jgi:hypothetical protein
MPELDAITVYTKFFTPSYHRAIPKVILKCWYMFLTTLPFFYYFRSTTYWLLR